MFFDVRVLTDKSNHVNNSVNKKHYPLKHNPLINLDDLFTVEPQLTSNI